MLWKIYHYKNLFYPISQFGKETLLEDWKSLTAVNAQSHSQHAPSAPPPPYPQKKKWPIYNFPLAEFTEYCLPSQQIIPFICDKKHKQTKSRLRYFLLFPALTSAETCAYWKRWVAFPLGLPTKPEKYLNSLVAPVMKVQPQDHKNVARIELEAFSSFLSFNRYFKDSYSNKIVSFSLHFDIIY